MPNYPTLSGFQLAIRRNGRDGIGMGEAETDQWGWNETDRRIARLVRASHLDHQFHLLAAAQFEEVLATGASHDEAALSAFPMVEAWEVQWCAQGHRLDEDIGREVLADLIRALAEAEVEKARAWSEDAAGPETDRPISELLFKAISGHAQAKMRLSRIRLNARIFTAPHGGHYDF